MPEVSNRRVGDVSSTQVRLPRVKRRRVGHGQGEVIEPRSARVEPFAGPVGVVVQADVEPAVGVHLEDPRDAGLKTSDEPEAEHRLPEYLKRQNHGSHV